VLIDWPRDFDDYLTRMEKAAAEPGADRERFHILLAQLSVLADLDEPPTEDSATLKRVRQSLRYPVWRVSHPYREGIAIRLIVWFPNDGRAVVALFAGDKARMGDVFYSSVGPRADAAIDSWINQTRNQKGHPS
jgi:hypothetical protein